MIKNNIQMSFCDVHVDRKLHLDPFYQHISIVIDWNRIDKELRKIYTKGKSVDGREAYSPTLLFKMLFIGQWYGLSDVEVEKQVSLYLPAMRFCGLTMEESVPDHSTLSRFRKLLVEKKCMERLLRIFNKQLEEHKILVKSGVHVDATLTSSPRCPHHKPTYIIAEDRKEEERELVDIEKEQSEMLILKIEESSVDVEASWLKKRGKSTFGYKETVAVNDDGLILSVDTTAANVHDLHGLSKVLDQLEPADLKGGVYADKGYNYPKCRDYLKEHKIKTKIMKRAYKNKALTAMEKRFNKGVSKKRWVVERTFGSIKKWFKAGTARYIGLANTHFQHLIEAIAHNLYRSPGILMSNSEKR